MVYKSASWTDNSGDSFYFTAGDEFKFRNKEKKYIGSDDTRLTIWIKPGPVLSAPTG